ncbi:histidine kinase [Acidobacteria bacterium AH-259-A15]|nr:histidine kinase [Acidobacteria bacterium AH-259-A15]
MRTQHLLEKVGIFVFLSILITGSLLIFTFGAISFTALFLLWARQHWKSDSPAMQYGCGRSSSKDLDYLNGGMLFLCALWFYLNAAVDLYLARGNAPWQLLVMVPMSAFLFPPLLMHMIYQGKKADLSSLSPIWGITIATTYLISFAAISVNLLGLLFRLVPKSLMMRTGILIPVLFIGTAVFSAVLLSRSPKKKEKPQERRGRKWTLALWGVIAVLCVYALFSDWSFFSLLSVLLRAAPLYFLFVCSYYYDRFGFFDVFIKRGIFFFVTLILLVAFFSVVTPWLDRANWPNANTIIDPRWLKPILFGVLLLPLALILPWLYRKLEQWLDRAWLGRTFSPGEALKHFLGGIQRATRETELVERAETLLSTIFQAHTMIVLGSSKAANPSNFESVLEVPIRSRGEVVGLIRMGRRVNHTPFFSQDMTLLTSLADVFSSMLENVRLLEKRQQQEKREQQLILDASRSELKALRAQINPHFLFNALNAIAGLIHKNPGRAEETVEHLSEVFRCTLTRSEKEWVPLEDEIEFVRCYLGVEQARFGSRLQVELKVQDALMDLKIPSMVVQTLVENAVKHGIASVRGTGRIEIEAKRIEGRVRITVSDNGPGFAQTENSTHRKQSRSGYGLNNIRERLTGYFGSEATLKTERDQEAGLTIVSIEMPLSRVDEEKKVEASLAPLTGGATKS